MLISLIVAMGENFVIGNKGKMPWGEKPLPGDGKWFVKQTKEKPIIFGRKTFESLPLKPLPGRTNIVLTSNNQFQAHGCVIVHSVEEARLAAMCSKERDMGLTHAPAEEVMIAGGAEIYKLFLPEARRMYRTLVWQNFPGDTYFPITTDAEWNEWYTLEKELQRPTTAFPWTVVFEILERKSKPPRPNWLAGRSFAPPESPHMASAA